MQGKLFFNPEPTIGELEQWCIQQRMNTIIGVDEAGRGPLAGPVYAAAVCLKMDSLDAPWVRYLNDSKKLSESQRNDAFDLILSNAAYYAIAFHDALYIDEVNILQATLRAMEQAVMGVCQKLKTAPDCVFIDGNLPIKVPYKQRSIVKGDARSLNIAAASILAKVSRDRVMAQHHQQWPHYNFAQNKGYGTKEHRRAIEQHGPCPIHRKTFGGVKEFIGKFGQ